MPVCYSHNLAERLQEIACRERGRMVYILMGDEDRQN
jgi:hypothetical protein